MKVKVGDTGPAWAYGPVARSDFVRFAGAAHDFVELHYDDKAARRSGYKSVFGHGAMAAGMLGSFLTRWFGPASVRRLRVRFLAPVWPGDTLTAAGEVARIVDELAEVRIEMTRQDGEIVVSGLATVVVPGEAG